MPAVLSSFGHVEASGRLVGPPVFKTGEGSDRPLAGSIPVRLRYHPPHQPGSIEPLMKIVLDLAFRPWRSR